MANLEARAGRDIISGDQLLSEILDLIEAGLPRLALDDPVRAHLAPLAPTMAADLGRPAVRGLA